jgi:choline dehydrogenase-like flavoprotein
MTSHSPMPKHGLPVIQGKDITEATLSLEADVVVIGSGAGGAVTAYELAKDGKSVIILEAGPYIPSSEFTEELAVSFDTMFADHGGQANVTGDTTVLQGNLVGGSTVVNAAICFRTPDKVLAKWRDQFGLSEMSSEVLGPYFDRIEKNLSIGENTEPELNTFSVPMRDAAQKLDYPVANISRNIRDCALTGMCLAGCASDRKQSMLVTYLPWATAHGAVLYSDTRVDRIITESGVATGVEATVIDRASGKGKASVSVKAKTVVLAAGAIQSPILMIQSGIGNSSGMVGKNLAVHPTMSCIGEYPEDLYSPIAGFAGLYFGDAQDGDDKRYILEDAVIDPMELGVTIDLETGDEQMQMMQNYKRQARLAFVLSDSNPGEVSLKDGIKQINYDVTEEDFSRIRLAIKDIAKILFVAGFSKVYVPTFYKTVITSEAEIDAVVDAIPYGPNICRYTTYHPQGTLRMGSDPSNSVVSPTGETHDVDNLWVTDASIFPTSIMVNPSVSVYTLSSFIADKIKAA